MCNQESLLLPVEWNSTDHLKCIRKQNAEDVFLLCCCAVAICDIIILSTESTHTQLVVPADLQWENLMIQPLLKQWRGKKEVRERGWFSLKSPGGRSPSREEVAANLCPRPHKDRRFRKPPAGVSLQKLHLLTKTVRVNASPWTEAQFTSRVSLCHLVLSSHTTKILLLLVCVVKGLLSAALQPVFPSQVCTLSSRLLRLFFQSSWGRVLPSPFLCFCSYTLDLTALHMQWVLMGSDCHQQEKQPFPSTIFWLYLSVHARNRIKFMCTQATGHAAPCPNQCMLQSTLMISSDNQLRVWACPGGNYIVTVGRTL